MICPVTTFDCLTCDESCRLVRRSAFLPRIRDAIHRGRLKTRAPISVIEAADRAQQVADALPGLFR